MDGPQPEGLVEVLQEAADRFHANLDRHLPRAAPLLRKHLQRVPAGPQTVEVCLATRSFPAFSLPYWITPLEQRSSDRAFQVDLAYATLNGYYFVRILDNIADGDGPPELRGLIPTAAYFGSEFEAPFQKYFPPDHPFWSDFRAGWYEQAESAAIEPHLGEITLLDFQTVSARKFNAAKAPLAAAGHRYGRAAELPAWFGFVEEIGAFSQLINDLFDWHHDHVNGISSYVQSEYRRRRARNETIHRWIVREGFEWGARELERSIADLRATATRLDSVEPVLWLEKRARLLRAQVEDASDAIEALRPLANLQQHE